MAVDGRTLLLRLEPAVRPTDVPRPGGPVATLDGCSFADLLGAARSGAIGSGREPEVASLAEALPREALPRIAKALDLLEAHGSDRALIAYDRRTLVADVRTRTIEAELLAHEGPRPEAVDAAVRVPTPEEERPSALPGPPKAVHAPPGVIELLEARDSHT